MVRKYDPELQLSAWFAEIANNDTKRRKGKEREISTRLSNILLSDKILDDEFCKNALPKIVGQYAALVEKNSDKYKQEIAELENYELWHLMPEIWGYAI